MASGKKRRKQANASRKARTGKNAAHRDGDRRRRREMAKAVAEAVARKRAMQAFPGAILPDGSAGSGGQG